MKKVYMDLIHICQFYLLDFQDAIYFDAVLNTLRLDSKLQGQCMFRTVQLGQLATEYLDDRKTEFIQLEKAVKKDMKEREAELETIRHTVGGLNKKLRMLIRRDVLYDN